MKIFILHGPTASGKTLLMNYLLSEDFDYLEPLISFTTRRKRLYEKHGHHYYFFPRQQYLDYRRAGKIYEEISYLDEIYGVTTDELERVNNTKKNGLAIMNIEGIRIFKRKMRAQDVVTIFIYRDLKDIINSILNSDRKEEDKERRIELAKTEMLDITSCDYVVYNIGTLADSYKQLRNIIQKEINARPVDRKIKPGERYRHFKKGDVYEIITTALYTENYCPLVIYRDVKTGIDYARPYEMFCGKKELKYENMIVNRFELVKVVKEDQ
jgi:guanylate kinase